MDGTTIDLRELIKTPLALRFEDVLARYSRVPCANGCGNDVIWAWSDRKARGTQACWTCVRAGRGER